MNIDKGKNSNQAPAKQENIWQEILNSAMTKKDLEESNVFIFGDKFSGKRSLVKMINIELLQKGELEGIKQIKYFKDKEKFLTQTIPWRNSGCLIIHF
jgi:hypothetical protein